MGFEGGIQICRTRFYHPPRAQNHRINVPFMRREQEVLKQDLRSLHKKSHRSYGETSERNKE